MQRIVPPGMSRRHFMKHLAGASALTIPAVSLTNSLQVHGQDLKRRRKSAIMLWMGGGPSTMDIWDLKPGTATGGPFRPIRTSGDAEISEHMPLMAKQMHHLAVVRSMSTREADHGRGRYYMHTGYVPNPNVQHPSYGAVLSHELIDQRPELEIPPFVAVGGGSVGPGFLGMTWAPFVVNSSGRVRNLDMGMDRQRLMQRMATLDLIEKGFVSQNRGSAATDHAKDMLDKTLEPDDQPADGSLQGGNGEPQEVQDRYGNDGLRQAAALMARRLVEVGVPFVEVEPGRLGQPPERYLPDAGGQQAAGCWTGRMSALVEDLEHRATCCKDTAIIWMGEFSRTPRINGNAGPRPLGPVSWSVVVGGAGMTGGIRRSAQTNADGTQRRDRPLHVARRDGQRLPGAGHFAGDDVYQPQRPAHENCKQ